MSTKNAIRFLEDLSKDETKQERMSGTKTAEEVLACAAEGGYDFTIEELVEVQERITEDGELELTEDDLDAVAGGAEGAVSVGISVEIGISVGL